MEANASATLDRTVAAWLEARAGSAHTRRAYKADVRRFFAFCEAAPGEVTQAHVASWQRAMRKEGLAASTINRRLAAVSSFFEFCIDALVVAQNPVKAVERAKASAADRAPLELKLDDLRALFWSIPRDTVLGLRDRALVLVYFYTGQRATEVRELAWEDVDALPLPAYNATVEYLRAARRMEAIQEGDCVFTPLSDVAKRLPSVDEMPGGGLSSSFVNRVIRKCARRVGIEWQANARALRQASEMLGAS